MAVPDTQSFLLPVLKALADGKELSLADLQERVATSLRLTPDDKREMMPRGHYTVLYHRIYGAAKRLWQVGLVKYPRRGFRQLTEEGSRLLKDLPPSFGEYVRNLSADRQRKNNDRDPATDEVSSLLDATSETTPEERVQIAFQRLEDELQADLLVRIHQQSPSFLEQVIIDLLIAMGYGGGEAARGEVIGRSGDGGIDGAIKEDALGLDEVYVQAKKYAEGNTVGVNDMRNFVGAIDGANTTKGVFVTTADFTKPAKDYVKQSSKRIILINGTELARLMVQYGVGVRTREIYQLQHIDEDYFEAGPV
ncbi:MAG: restriction endonuclease [Caldilineaceae bacterium SB0662_bin_9]|uniref:Restriction endonuclease n=1 Tax=Caldilineaceae bacterium SB0662_bin_9 TaxID=2605258 RepID=A0A6B1DP41_9CHLR|nr:restriction endonuclease [Caldilineaceae bacterium SB0662_bin_9]